MTAERCRYHNISEIENIHFPEPEIDEPARIRGWLALGIVTFSVLLFVAHFIVPQIAYLFLCPAKTFVAGQSMRVGIFAALSIFPACLVLVVCTGFEGRGSPTLSLFIKRNVTVCITASVTVLLANIAVIANSALSYYCAAPIGVVVSSGVFGGLQHYRWSDVKIVRAYCWQSPRRGRAGYNSRNAGIILSFADGRSTFLSPNVDSYTTIRENLSGVSYQYFPPNPIRCPPGFYKLFRELAATTNREKD